MALILRSHHPLETDNALDVGIFELMMGINVELQPVCALDLLVTARTFDHHLSLVPFDFFFNNVCYIFGSF